jgi:NADH-quinone oxidoreductase subunit L
VRHPLDAHAHGQAHKEEHEVSHGAADAMAHEWHGPHEGPASMTFPLMALGVGAIVAGFVGIPHALGGRNAIERFLEPSFAAAVPSAPVALSASIAPSAPVAASELSAASTLGLMFFSVLAAMGGILTARHLYLRNPEMPRRLAARWHDVYELLLHKYYVDELYGATIIRSTFAAARGLWTFDARVIDGAVNGAASLTQITSWLSHMLDKYVVDGAVNLLGWTTGRGSFLVRRIQTGLLQNYALLMVLGLFGFLTVFLLAR